MKRNVITFLALSAAAAMLLPAQTFTVLHNFNETDGYYPAGLVQATDGDLYGASAPGGAYGYGTIFKITTAGKLTTLYNFCAQSGCPDGSAPNSLIQASDGNFYGTTGSGGPTGYGTAFKITPTGTLTTLYSFCPNDDPCLDGWAPETGLVEGADGNFYGTTLYGGAYHPDQGGYGTVFRITPGGTLTTIYSFCALSHCADGASPFAALMQAENGNLYGTTWHGGLALYGSGTVFEITPSGTLTTLVAFACNSSGCPAGNLPRSTLIQTANGEMYGTNSGGGKRDGTGEFTGGTVFKMNPSGKVRALGSFCSANGCPSGANPQAGVIQATDGNFYGTNQNSTGTLAGGSVYSVTPDGTLTTVHSFCVTKPCMDGRDPVATLVQATDGDLYGTATLGGAYGDGTVFRISLGLSPFVKPQPAAGAVGAGIDILGTNLTGTTGVSFNGVAASFTVVSHSLITATVPVGATTGTILVTTPGGTLESNVLFRVRE